ncbi:chromosome segregation protein [Rutstroemia sp. NJR-2017a WRK4]|nr:chromosome segregation protein [Rutstroemia sp. NJR-2017a WRK4]
MSRPKTSTLAGLIESDSEEEQLVERSMTRADTKANTAAKKLRGRPKAAPSKVIKAKAPTSRTSGRLGGKPELAMPLAKNNKRTVLADKTNREKRAQKELESADDTGDIIMEDVASGDELDAEVAAVEEVQSKNAKKPGATRAKAGKKEKGDTTEVEEVEVPVIKAGRPRKGKGRPRDESPVPVEASPEKIIQETQVPVDGMEVEADFEEEEEPEDSVPEVPQRETRPSQGSKRRRPSTARHRAGSTSDTERSDPAVRRRLGDVTKKLESVEAKYEDLREVGVKEAERIFDRYKKATEEKTNSSNELIASLKSNLAAQTALAKETKNLKKTIESQDALVTNLQTQIHHLEAALSEAQAENKTLSTKLAANRKITASYESATVKVPGSAVKANGGMRMIGSAEAAQAAQAAQLKEDLYSDLTGLIIRGVKREAEEDVFDCIQTGRNGTLHFKLGVENETTAHGDADCRYTPLLDPSRDKPLLELLPDYLVDEIEFPRPQAARFYARITRALTEKPASIGGAAEGSDE